MDKLAAIKMAEETIRILQTGAYTNHKGNIVDLEPSLSESITRAVLYSPSKTDQLLGSIGPVEQSVTTTIEVTPETTLAAAKRLSVSGMKVCCLNFASAKHPGGGFLTGARAQEESLARSSGLYPSIVQMKEMYDFNARTKTGLYSDYMIFSPNVPVFRDDNGTLLDKPYFVSMISAPAVNAGVVSEREPQHVKRIHEVLRRRIEKILAVALAHQQEIIILGAFGCGVFRNSPEEVARLFREVFDSVLFRSVFKQVVFAVYDPAPQKTSFYAFQRHLR